jgi:hypothetical protein
MTWQAVPGQNYQVQVSTNLAGWSVAPNMIATSTAASYTDPVPVVSQKVRFFRVVTP